MKIGLSGARTNPNRLKAGRDVPQKKLVETFNKMTPYSGFWYTEFRDPMLKARVEKTWPLCYGKAIMPYLKLIAKESTLRIVVKSLGSPSIKWLLLKKPNKNQQSKKFKCMTMMEV